MGLFGSCNNNSNNWVWIVIIIAIIIICSGNDNVLGDNDCCCDRCHSDDCC